MAISQPSKGLLHETSQALLLFPFSSSTPKLASFLLLLVCIFHHPISSFPPKLGNFLLLLVCLSHHLISSFVLELVNSLFLLLVCLFHHLIFFCIPQLGNFLLLFICLSYQKVVSCNGVSTTFFTCTLHTHRPLLCQACVSLFKVPQHVATCVVGRLLVFMIPWEAKALEQFNNNEIR